MDGITTLTGILSGGVAGAVISAIWNHFSKLLLQRNGASFTAKLATLEHDFQRSQKQAQAEIDRSVFVTRAHFETEFEAMKDIFSCLSEVQLAINGVRPMIAIEPADETEGERLKRLWERLKTLMIATDKLLNTSEAKAPFYSEELYDSVNVCWRAAVTEINTIREAVKDALNVTGFLQAQKNKENFSEGYLKSVKIIRDRISKLAILPGH
ncbi:MAG: hypothetical protein P4L26_10370 [Terracidiphilus sp.]|nr:hypothetical protein [Terracidiphilus sp.]